MADAGFRAESLDALRELVGECGQCGLSGTRTRLVFGAGDPGARVMLIGEAPGREEDLSGEPFVGSAGKLLSALLEHAGLTRDEVFIANVLKCRPPENRNPRREEIEMCAPLLREQVRLVDPDVIVTLGNFATRFMLDTKEGITAVRGRVWERDGRKVLPVFHPAAVIYDRSKQATLFSDFETLAGLLAEKASR